MTPSEPTSSEPTPSEPTPSDPSTTTTGTPLPAGFHGHVANIGVKTRYVMPKPEHTGTKGTIMDIVTGVVRGVTCPQNKLDEIVSKINKNLEASKK